MKAMHTKKSPLFAGAVTLISLIGGSAAVHALPEGEAGAEIAANSIRLADGVVRADAYVKPTVEYVAVNGAAVHADYKQGYSGKHIRELENGKKIQALAAVKDWDWILVGEKGVGIGYVPRSLLCPVKYCPPSS